MKTWQPLEQLLGPFGWVYFIEAPDVKRFKIGFTSNAPEKRLAALQTGSPVKLELAGCKPAFQSMERIAHKQLDACRIDGEWFNDGWAVGSIVSVLDTPEDILAEESRIRMEMRLFDELSRQSAMINESAMIAATGTVLCDGYQCCERNRLKAITMCQSGLIEWACKGIHFPNNISLKDAETVCINSLTSITHSCFCIPPCARPIE